MEIEVTEEGIREMEQVLKELPDALQRNVYGAGLKSAADVVVAKAKQDAPVVTGVLRDRIRSRRVSQRVPVGPPGGDRVQRIPGAAAWLIMSFIGRFQEHGTKYIDAKEFGRRAMMSTSSQQVQAFRSGTQKDLNKTIRSVVRGTLSKRKRRLV